MLTDWDEIRFEKYMPDGNTEAEYDHNRSMVLAEEAADKLDDARTNILLAFEHNNSPWLKDASECVDALMEMLNSFQMGKPYTAACEGRHVKG